MRVKSILYKFFYFVIFSLLFVGLVGCESNNIPQNLKVEEGVLTWDEVEEASKYLILIGNDEIEVNTTSFDLKTLTLESGEYKVKVKAFLNDKYGPYSEEVVYLVNIAVLSKPGNVRIDGDIIYWSSVANAKEYEVTVGTEKRRTTNTSIALSEFGNKFGRVRITVKAIGEGSFLSSEESDLFFHLIDISTETLLEEAKKIYLQIDGTTEESATNQAEEIVQFLSALTENAGILNLQILEIIEIVVLSYPFESPENLNNLLGYLTDNEEFSDVQIVEVLYNLISLSFSEASDPMELEMQAYINDNAMSVKLGLYPIVKVVKYSYLETVTIITKILNSEELTPAEIILVRDEFVNSLVFPTSEEFGNLLELIKAFSLIALDYAQFDNPEIKEKTINTISNLFDYYGETYSPMLEIFKELLNVVTLEDLELIVNSEHLDFTEVLMELQDRLKDNQVINTNFALIEEMTLDLIFEGKIEVFPYLISEMFDIPIEEVEIYYDFVLANEELVLNSIDEFVDFFNKSILFNLGAPVSIADPFDLFFYNTNWDYLMNLGVREIDDIVDLTKQLLINFYFDLDEITLSQEEIDLAIDVDDFSDLLSTSINIFAHTLYVVGNSGRYIYTYEQAIYLFEVLDQLYETELETLYNKLESLIYDYVVENELFLTLLRDLGVSLPDDASDLLDPIGSERTFYLMIDEFLDNVDLSNITPEDEAEIVNILSKFTFLSFLNIYLEEPYYPYLEYNN